MKSVFIDTGYFLALELAQDQNHELALRHWREVSKALPQLVTTSFVFDEVVTFFNNRGFHAKSVEVGNRLLHSPSVQFVHVDQPLFYEAWSYFQKHQDKRYSFTDCVSFVVMKQMGIATAFAFDKHFQQAGLGLEPQPPEDL